MPLLSNAQKLFVGGTSINQVFSNGFVVWPKICRAMSGRPNPLPPGNDTESTFPKAFYDILYTGTISVEFERIVYFDENRGLYDRYQIDGFDTELCEWRTYGVEYTGAISSPGISIYRLDKAAINDFQSYDFRVIPIFTATGLPDESVVLYAKDTPATVPDRSPSKPSVVIESFGPSIYTLKTPGSVVPTPSAYKIEKYRIEKRLASSDVWEFWRDEPTSLSYIREGEGLILGETYVLRAAAISSICFSQSEWGESEPFLFE